MQSQDLPHPPTAWQWALGIASSGVSQYCRFIPHVRGWVYQVVRFQNVAGKHCVARRLIRLGNQLHPQAPPKPAKGEALGGGGGGGIIAMSRAVSA